MFETVLIANRGEIACRIIRTARRMGLRCIAVYSRADREALHVKLADEAHEIGPAPAASSYLRADRILDVARSSGAQCIHPGYGFLSENAGFAQACAEAGIVFIGPQPAAISAMGLKDRAKALMRAAGVPVVPGYDGSDQDGDRLALEGARIGWPVLIKAVAGGGGKGMRRVAAADEFADALEGARREALAFFGDDRVLVEKYVEAPRHIEVQVFGDSHGNLVHLFERDCSLQRRHQKVIEEAPAPGMNEDMRAAVCAAALSAARAVNYQGAGTVEFIADASRGLRADAFWFMEMNTRLQVEHPVSEAITGIDFVEWQFRIAAGEALPLAQADIAMRGHAIEARLYAEDPAHDFLPSPGHLHTLVLPQGEGVRVDSGVEAGGSVSAHYDPMIAKIIAHGADRQEARWRLCAALEQTRVAGVRNNAMFLHSLVASETFASGMFDTGTIARDFAAGFAAQQRAPAWAVRLGALALWQAERDRLNETERRLRGHDHSPFHASDLFALTCAIRRSQFVVVDGVSARVQFFVGDSGGAAEAGCEFEGVTFAGELEAALAAAQVIIVHDSAHVFSAQGVYEISLAQTASAGESGALDDGASGHCFIRAPMHGKLTSLLVQAGDHVTRGQRLAIVEAMKMEHVLQSPVEGVIGVIEFSAGDQVMQGARIMEIEQQAGEAGNNG